MLQALYKSKQLSLILLERLSDYLALLRIELKMQGREIAIQLFGYLSAALFTVFALLFTGVAIIVSFWDSNYRGLAAWGVVALYFAYIYSQDTILAAAAAAMALARRHADKRAALQSLREEFRRDVALLRETL